MPRNSYRSNFKSAILYIDDSLNVRVMNYCTERKLSYREFVQKALLGAMKDG